MNIETELKSLANKKQAEILKRFFKTGKGQYGEGDVFLGIKVPIQRQVANKYKDLPLGDVEALLQSRVHEHRLTALFILIHQFEQDPRRVFDLYMRNTKHINNWDLVDLSAPKIVGVYLADRDRSILYKLARSSGLWEKRISILATFAFIKEDDFEDALTIAGLLLNDRHDLIHKAVGWMLREIGKRSQVTEERFLRKHHKNMPRTMLRYAIERFSEKKRKSYMAK